MGADVCRTSSWASRRPPDVISAVAILDPRWRRRKWRHPGPGAVFSIPIAEAEENGGPSASGRHLGWPHFRFPQMRSSKMATGSGRAAIFLRLRNGDRKNRPILLTCHVTFYPGIPFQYNASCQIHQRLTIHAQHQCQTFGQYLPVRSYFWALR